MATNNSGRSMPDILLTRPIAASKRFAEQLEEFGVRATITISPVLEIMPNLVVDVPKDIAGAIFTSSNGVRFAPPRALPAWCVGDATAEAAKSRGWDAISAQSESGDLIKRIIADAPDGQLVHFRGRLSRGDIAAQLTKAGISVSETIVYDQVPRPLSARARTLLNGASQVILPVFSPNSAFVLFRQGPFLAPVTLVAMSEAVVEAVKAQNAAKICISPSPNVQSLIKCILQEIETS